MFQTLKNAWHIADLRKKILYTLMILVLFRLGTAVPVPFLDAQVLQQMLQNPANAGNLLGYLDILSGGAFARATIFALSITPYITSSIVIQLLTVAIPALERMAKEGEDGRRKINKITRYVTVALALLQAWAYYTLLRNQSGAVMYRSGFAGIFSAIVIIAAFMGGAMLIVYLGERIDEHGIGNGISMILFAGIVSRGPAAIQKLWIYLQMGSEQPMYYFTVPLIVVLFLALIVVIIIMTNAERRIPVQYAKKVVGRKMYGGQSTFIPIKVNMSGVLPIIFASSLLAIPGTIKAFVAPNGTGFWANFLGAFNYNTPLYAVLYFILILAFNYFYVAIQYNPIEMSNNLRNNSGTIPGIRPGRPTSDFIARIISKITLVGGIFLALVAVLPIGIGGITKMNIALGGTSIIIVVGVALDTFRQLESQMMMRHYKGFLE
ncbi:MULTISPECIES: preprotein translocase subunit SecY [Anaerotruncus]|jgi:preprotein translocase subunit SecY|uniref:Protein translocase subunit SecY n=2 Tax=Anaerotruncus TaxID=244127 RepID=A0A498CYX2_9FIRM|nr:MULTISPECIES: preprotein translocase subunit SecY [Anaerotruncus]MBC3939362.1 preprotein translocase subunit SecY [Anaerotruncus massiliensis (ex Togo et al. 2019)]MCQ4896350.1 preprotein translocase subunit SecY [Anaerotruncus sp. DFI.9.16]RLL09543.1 preprotein translocase subunit SecY [Anaerotruncus massiliensis (ex Liu et al. 2021)]GKH48679.1 protein translocase subunit SecY [Oscillospiraceae bacterium]